MDLSPSASGRAAASLSRRGSACASPSESGRPLGGAPWHLFVHNCAITVRPSWRVSHDREHFSDYPNITILAAQVENPASLQAVMQTKGAAWQALADDRAETGSNQSRSAQNGYGGCHLRSPRGTSAVAVPVLNQKVKIDLVFSSYGNERTFDHAPRGKPTQEQKRATAKLSLQLGFFGRDS